MGTVKSQLEITSLDFALPDTNLINKLVKASGKVNWWPFRQSYNYLLNILEPALPGGAVEENGTVVLKYEQIKYKLWCQTVGGRDAYFISMYDMKPPTVHQRIGNMFWAMGMPELRVKVNKRWMMAFRVLYAMSACMVAGAGGMPEQLLDAHVTDGEF